MKGKNLDSSLENVGIENITPIYCGRADIDYTTATPPTFGIKLPTYLQSILEGSENPESD